MWNTSYGANFSFPQQDREAEPRFSSAPGARPPYGGAPGGFGGPGAYGGAPGGGGGGGRQIYVSNVS